MHVVSVVIASCTLLSASVFTYLVSLVLFSNCTHYLIVVNLIQMSEMTPTDAEVAKLL